VSGEPAEVVLVPHTHWDREWYEPFQVFRLRLVELLDDVLARAEAEPGFRFTVDGQLAAVEDYLEVRPENRDRLAARVGAGQLAVGPWQILLDEFLCSGETIVRNLALGVRGATALGGAMPVGYLPDMFGHCAQMPQILVRAGFGHACLWRGVPARVDGHAFRWVAPDGSGVRVEYLWDGYGNAGELFVLPERLAEAAAAYRAETAGRYGTDPVLGMVGGDHSRPRPDLLPLAGAAGLQLATLTEYVQRFAPDDPTLPVVEGELRSPARGNILPGVISIRVGLKQAMARAERTVWEAEALAARLPEITYQRYLELAWHRIIACTAHDSVTGCGVDETAEQVEGRLAEAGQLGRAVRDRLLDTLAEPVPRDAYLVVNPLPWPRTVLVELADVEAPAAAQALLPDGTAVPVQGLASPAALLVEETMPAEDLVRLLRRIHGRELFGQQIERYSIEPPQVVFELAQVARTPSFDKVRLGDELAKAVRETTGSWRVRTVAAARRRVLAAVPVPASGQVAVRFAAEGAASLPVCPVSVSERTLDNGAVRVAVAGDGTLTVTGLDGVRLTGVGRLVDGGDRGDAYSYGPPAHDRLAAEPAAVSVTVVEPGPLRGILRVVREYDWPLGLAADDPDRRAEQTVRVPVTTLVSVCVGEPFARLEISFVNLAADHRLRLHVPLPAPATGSEAEGQFAVTRRGLVNEGGWGEYPLPAFPASGFVTAGAATVLLSHATEYELVAGGSELALTLLRAVGWMSVNVHPLRDEPAGPQLPVPGAQYLGREVRTRLAVLPSRDGWAAVGAARRGAEFRHGGLVRRGTAAAERPAPDPATGFEVTGDGVAVSALRPVEHGVELRLVAMTDRPTTAVVSAPAVTAARRTDLLGRPAADLPVRDGAVTVPLSPWEIATVRVS
jgi:alpha-mannosidase